MSVLVEFTVDGNLGFLKQNLFDLSFRTHDKLRDNELIIKGIEKREALLLLVYTAFNLNCRLTSFAARNIRE